MQIISDVKLDYEDVLIVPKRSFYPNKKGVGFTRAYTMANANCHPLQVEGIPIIASNMRAVGTFAMADSLSAGGIYTALHKFYPQHEYGKFFVDKDKPLGHTFFTMGISNTEVDRFYDIHSGSGSLRLPMVCIDVANGYTERFKSIVSQIRREFPETVIMAGNVCTPNVVETLVMAGADIVKIGIGGHSNCSTRHVAGVGYPMLSCIIECADAAHGLDAHVCADGGCRTSGDVVKAFAAGADFVMIDEMLIGCDECEGEWSYTGRIKKVLKFYCEANDEEEKCKHVTVPYRGPAEYVIKKICGGLAEACSYVGAKHLKDLSECTTFIRCNRSCNVI